MSGQPWYRHHARDFLGSVVGLGPDAIGAYIVILDLIYASGGPVPNNTRFIGGTLGCSSRLAASLIAKLIKAGKLTLKDDMLGNARADVEMTAKHFRDPIPTAVRLEVSARDGDVCSYCGSDTGPFEIDHIYPYSRGGTHSPENLTVACRSCNRSKGARSVSDWMGLKDG